MPSLISDEDLHGKNFVWFNIGVSIITMLVGFPSGSFLKKEEREGMWLTLE
jgi:hypothetical protein